MPSLGYGGVYTGGYSGSYGGQAPPPGFNPLQFDHGLGKPLRAIVQDGCLDLLMRLHRYSGGYINEIVPFPTTIAGRHDDQGIALVHDLTLAAPAILIAVGDRPFQPAGADPFSWSSDLSVHVYFYVNSIRSRIERQRGDVVSAADATADPGVYVMMEHAMQLLCGKVPGGTKSMIKELRPTNERQLFSDGGVDVWEQAFTVRLSGTINGKRDIDQELIQIETYHRLADSQQPDDPPIVETNTVVRP